MLKRFIRKYLLLIIFIFFSNCIYITANIPFIQRVLSTSSGTISTFQHHTVVMDYLNYITFIRESREGAWRLPDLHTTEPTSTNGNMFYFIILGKLSKLTGLSPTFSYHLSRVLEFQFYIYFLFLLLNYMLGKTAGFWASVISIIASPPYSIMGIIIYGKDEIGIPAWWMLTPFRRVDMLPHHALSAMLLILEVLFIARSIEKKSIKIALIASILAFFSTMFHPVSGLFFIFTHTIATGICFINQKMHKHQLLYFPILYLLIPVFFSGLAILLQRYEVITTYPYNQWLYFDVIWYDRYTHYARDFFIGGGPILIFGGILALKTLLSSVNAVWILISIWGLLSYLIMPISTELGVAKFRLALLLPYIPLSMLYIKWIKDSHYHEKRSLLTDVTILISIILFVGTSIPSLPVMYKDWAALAGNIEPGMAVSQNWVEAVDFLRENTPPYSHILSGEINGILIPSRIRAVVYVGQYLETINFEYKKELVRLFFGGQLTDDEAKNLLIKNRINYIFYSFEERAWGTGFKKYNLPLKIVYKNNTITIYEFTRNN